MCGKFDPFITLQIVPYLERVASKLENPLLANSFEAISVDCFLRNKLRQMNRIGRRKSLFSATVSNARRRCSEASFLCANDKENVQR